MKKKFLILITIFSIDMIAELCPLKYSKCDNKSVGDVCQSGLFNGKCKKVDDGSPDGVCACQ